MTKTHWISEQKPTYILAPMEGVTDAPMRTFFDCYHPSFNNFSGKLSGQSGFDFFVTEFFRISNSIPPAKTFQKHMPELKTPLKTPVHLQLLGGSASQLLLATEVALSAGAQSIDLNFGCPAPTVNRHDGGASLLKDTKRLKEIIQTLRSSVPKEIPVSAKLRLGWEDPNDIYKNAIAAAEAGASWITIHGRTRMQGYAPPALWEPIGKVRELLHPLPVVANGDLWTIEDLNRCKEVTGCKHFMFGRSALANPNLVFQAKYPEQFSNFEFNPKNASKLFLKFIQICDSLSDHPTYALARVKQWGKMIQKNPTHKNLEFDSFFEILKRLSSLPDLKNYLEKNLN